MNANVYNRMMPNEKWGLPKQLVCFDWPLIEYWSLDMETMNIVDTQMYIDGYQVKLVSDKSYGSFHRR